MKNIMKKGLFIRSVLIVCTIFLGCSLLASQQSLSPVDYSIENNWLHVEHRPYPSEIPDIFYLYPTAWKCEQDTLLQLCDIDNKSMRKGAPDAYRRQALPFEEQHVGRVFAPFYRQYNAAGLLRLSWKQRNNVTGKEPTDDATAAFVYFLKNYNKGRPFILLAHSQGADVMCHLLSGYLKDHPEVLKNMIAAYVIGTPVTTEYLANNPHLKFATGAWDTGVLISYNTQGQNVETNIFMSGQVGKVINPINWGRSGNIYAPKSENLGSLLPYPLCVNPPEGYKIVKEYADALTDTVHGVVICKTADENLPVAYGGQKGIYHSFDIPFYINNLIKNAKERTDRFWEKKSK